MLCMLGLLCLQHDTCCATTATDSQSHPQELTAVALAGQSTIGVVAGVYSPAHIINTVKNLAQMLVVLCHVLGRLP